MDESIIYQFTILVIFVVAMLFFIFMYRYSVALRKSLLEEEKTKQALTINNLQLEKTKLENEKLEADKRVRDEVNLRLEQEVTLRNNELVTSTLLINQQHDILRKIQDEIKSLTKSMPAESKSKIQKIDKIIRANSNLSNDWDQFRLHFEKVHPTFFKTLKSKSANLSQHDLRHCAYIKIGLATKEIARLMNINPTSVQIARVRLKKKLELPKEVDLMGYISSL